MNNRKSPIKQQRTKNSPSTPVVINNNRVRSNSSMATSYSKNGHSQPQRYSKSNSPTSMSSGSPPAVPVFYSLIYADPPEDCSLLPQPPESWYLKSNTETIPTANVEEKVKSKPKSHSKKNNNRGFYSPFNTSRPYISVRA